LGVPTLLQCLDLLQTTVILKLLLYNFFIFLYQTGARLLVPFNNKARLWLFGRRQWQSRLKREMEACGFHRNKQVVWMHASSLGEFEQGRPVLEAVKRQYPNTSILVSFFSPSGYETMKNYEGADIVCYLPADTAKNAWNFLHIVQPSIVLWVKYEYWYHHLEAIHQRHIPLLLISGIFRADQPFFKWYGGLHRKILSFFTHFFVQTEEAAELLKTVLQPLPGSEFSNKKTAPANRISVAGDTRFDRVIEIAENWTPVYPLERWLKQGARVMVAGSTWPADEEELVHYTKANPDMQLIVAPHQVEPDLLKDTLQLFDKAMLFSDLMEEGAEKNTTSNVLIINNVGILSRLYAYGQVCYVGGGFTGDGVHNVLEAAVYGKPVIHGPEYEKYAEAVGLIHVGGSFEFENALELEAILANLFNDKAYYEQSAAKAKEFVYRHSGGSRQVLDYIGKLVNREG
jgi:3-deoxy-D-manno-octulosonic-acid transferase